MTEKRHRYHSFVSSTLYILDRVSQLHAKARMQEQRMNHGVKSCRGGNRKANGRSLIYLKRSNSLSLSEINREPWEQPNENGSCAGPNAAEEGGCMHGGEPTYIYLDKFEFTRNRLHFLAAGSRGKKKKSSNVPPHVTRRVQIGGHIICNVYAYTCIIVIVDRCRSRNFYWSSYSGKGRQPNIILGSDIEFTPVLLNNFAIYNIACLRFELLFIDTPQCIVRSNFTGTSRGVTFTQACYDHNKFNFRTVTKTMP